ncbi:MAG TPA: DUF2157 domain-containing protein [Spirochaetota bacterium]
MNIQLNDLQTAVKKKIITKAQMESILSLRADREKVTPSFDIIHLLYYFGALVVIGAMGMFMTIGWEDFGGVGIMAIALVYAGIFALAGYIFWYRKKAKVAGGLLYTMAVCMTPLIVYGFERALGVWPMDNPGSYSGFHVWINGSWLMMELATIGVGLITIGFIRFPFITMPIAFALWYLSMDLVPLLFGKNEFDWDERKGVSVIVGLIMIIISYILDRRTKEDFSFWGYLFGMIAFWGGLSMMDSGSELNKFLYCLLNVFLMFLSIWLGRRVFMVFGGIGVFGYLGYLSYHVFSDSLIFPFALSFLGLLLIACAVVYQKNERKIIVFVDGIIPDKIKRYRPQSRVVR